MLFTPFPETWNWLVKVAVLTTCMTPLYWSGVSSFSVYSVHIHYITLIQQYKQYEANVDAMTKQTPGVVLINDTTFWHTEARQYVCTQI